MPLTFGEHGAAVAGQFSDKLDESSFEAVHIHAEPRQGVFLVRSAVRRPVDHVANYVPIEFIDR
ncbi:hypothetical protein BST13_29850 [Mycobacterium aquaticum]|uniref:Uncharacterized protein n=1 Tax=Mycobacterium aquaticum TaxID=1927124 RepID=A0A1X0ADN3_9MYCO|nr:hypothetical protein BST13_29850 [Mycobacterium aquaticum]